MYSLPPNTVKNVLRPLVDLFLASPAPQSFDETGDTGTGTLLVLHAVGQRREADVIESQVEK